MNPGLTALRCPATGRSDYPRNSMSPSSYVFPRPPTKSTSSTSSICPSHQGTKVNDPCCWQHTLFGVIPRDVGVWDKLPAHAPIAPLADASSHRPSIVGDPVLVRYGITIHPCPCYASSSARPLLESSDTSSREPSSPSTTHRHPLRLRDRLSVPCRDAVGLCGSIRSPRGRITGLHPGDGMGAVAGA
jgi:hypothetical protein